MSFTIRNITSGPAVAIVLDDIGITLPAGGDRNLLDRLSLSSIYMSADLGAAVAADDIIILDNAGDPLSKAASLVALSGELILTGGAPASTLIEYAHIWPGNTEIIDKKAVFDGSGDRVIVRYPSAIEAVYDGSSDYCIEMDVKADENSTQAIWSIGHGAASWSATDGHTIILQQSSGNLGLYWNIGGGGLQSIVAAADIQTAQVRITAVRSGGTVSLYVGTSRIATTTTTTAIVKPTAGTLVNFFGDTGSTDSPFKGKIGTVRGSSVSRYDPTDTTIVPLILTDDDDTIYFNTWNGPDGLTPALNTD